MTRVRTYAETKEQEQAREAKRLRFLLRQVQHHTGTVTQDQLAQMSVLQYGVVEAEWLHCANCAEVVLGV